MTTKEKLAAAAKKKAATDEANKTAAVKAMADKAVKDSGHTDAELDAVEAVIEATASSAKSSPKKKKPAKKNLSGKSFADILPGIKTKGVDDMVHSLGNAVTAREKFETGKASTNTSIQRTLKKVRGQVVTKTAASVIIACNVDPGFINRVTHDGSRYNVYAIGKFADVVKALTGGQMANAINIAVMKSMFAFRKAKVPFNMDMAKAAASDKIRVDATVRKLLMSHTVSASTAPTQASSTMQALTTLGIVEATGSKRNPVYNFSDHPVVTVLEEALAA